MKNIDNLAPFLIMNIFIYVHTFEIQNVFTQLFGHLKIRNMAKITMSVGSRQ